MTGVEGGSFHTGKSQWVKIQWETGCSPCPKIPSHKILTSYKGENHKFPREKAGSQGPDPLTEAASSPVGSPEEDPAPSTP